MSLEAGKGNGKWILPLELPQGIQPSRPSVTSVLNNDNNVILFHITILRDVLQQLWKAHQFGLVMQEKSENVF